MEIPVSNVATDEWEYDPEVGGEAHLLCSGLDVEAGLWRFMDATDPIKWTVPVRETLMVLEGEARIEIAGGPALQLRAGDIASLPAGAKTTWHLITPFKKFSTIQL